NSLLVGVTNCTMSHDFSDHTTWHTTDLAGVFASGGYGGTHYLASGSTNRNSGGTNINLVLKEALQTLTTYPPKVTNGTISGYVMLKPQAPPDNDGQLDRGYHAPIIDWLISTNGLALPGAGILVSNAVVAVDFTVTPTGFDMAGSGSI